MVGFTESFSDFFLSLWLENQVEEVSLHILLVALRKLSEVYFAAQNFL